MTEHPLHVIGRDIHLTGATAITALSKAANVPYNTAFGWYYRRRIPRYDAAVRAKVLLLAKAAQEISDPTKRLEVEMKIEALWRA